MQISTLIRVAFRSKRELNSPIIKSKLTFFEIRLEYFLVYVECKNSNKREEHCWPTSSWIQGLIHLTEILDCNTYPHNLTFFVPYCRRSINRWRDYDCPRFCEWVSRHNHFPGWGVVAKQNGICAAALFTIIIGRGRETSALGSCQDWLGRERVRFRVDRSTMSARVMSKEEEKAKVGSTPLTSEFRWRHKFHVEPRQRLRKHAFVQHPRNDACQKANLTN